jgi:alkyldihydroxyacetonephosphate synthase
MPATLPVPKRKFWGWGMEDEGLGRVELEQLGATFADRFGIESVRIQEPPQAEELDLRPPRVSPPSSLEAAFSADAYDRGGPHVREIVSRSRARVSP